MHQSFRGIDGGSFDPQLLSSPAPSPAVGLDLDGRGGCRVVEERPLVGVPLVVLVVGPAHRQVQLTTASVRAAAVVHVVPAVAVVTPVVVAPLLQEWYEC